MWDWYSVGIAGILPISCRPAPPFQVAYLAGELDPGFEVLTAFEMRHTTNAPAADTDIQWLRETMANTRPDNIAQPERGSGLADYSWRCVVLG